MDKVVTDSSRTLEEKKGRSLERIRTQAIHHGRTLSQFSIGPAEKVQKLQNRAAAILRLESNEHDFNESFRALSWRKFNFQGLEATSIMTYKNLHGISPENLLWKWRFFAPNQSFNEKVFLQRC